MTEAVQAGARKFKACEEIGISVRTLQRWVKGDDIQADQRPTAHRPVPVNKLSEAEKQAILAVCHEVRFSSLPPTQIVPQLADEGRYLASESSFYRVLRQAGEQQRRGRQQSRTVYVVTTHKASKANELWCWDISWLPGPAKGIYLYLYLMMDVYSRKIVGFEVHEQECADYAALLLRKSVLSESIANEPLVLHSDNGSPMKGESMLAMLDRLGVTASFSRPRVSNDNAYAESLFRTTKYRPDYPYQGFGSLEAARTWMLAFVRWYNHEHKHKGLKFVTPHERHTGLDKAIRQQRNEVYAQAKKLNPARWSGDTRDWSIDPIVWLNPEKAPETTKKVA